MIYKFRVPFYNNSEQLHFNRYKLDDRPYVDWKEKAPFPSFRFVSLDNELHQWFVDNNIEYKISHKMPKIRNILLGYHIEIENKSEAMLYKLIWV